jgi:hypothetical protein
MWLACVEKYKFVGMAVIHDTNKIINLTQAVSTPIVFVYKATTFFEAKL